MDSGTTQLFCLLSLLLFCEQQVKTLNITKSTGHDNVAARELKLAGSAVIPSLRKLFNRCLEFRKFPSQWKNAKVKAIFKKGKKNNEDKLQASFSP